MPARNLNEIDPYDCKDPAFCGDQAGLFCMESPLLLMCLVAVMSDSESGNGSHEQIG